MAVCCPGVLSRFQNVCALAIALANAIIHPDTVMVHVSHAGVALAAMF